MKPWGFYGRQRELAELRTIFQRNRWFFVQVSGRRRIGKTSLIHQALNQAGRSLRLYIQIPDSDVSPFRIYGRICCELWLGWGVSLTLFRVNG